MNALFRYIKNDKILLIGFSISFILSLLTIFFIVINYTKLPPYIPLFNQLPWGESRLGPQYSIFLPFTFASIILVTNISFSKIIYHKTPLLSRILCITSALISFFVFLFTVRTIYIIV